MVTNNIYPSVTIQFHRHSRNGIYTVRWYNDEVIAWQTKHTNGICSIEDFKCVNGRLRNVCLHHRTFEVVVRTIIEKRLHQLACNFTQEQLHQRIARGTRIGEHYYLTKYNLV